MPRGASNTLSIWAIRVALDLYKVNFFFNVFLGNYIAFIRFKYYMLAYTMNFSRQGRRDVNIRALGQSDLTGGASNTSA
jgi:hypothetical protein